MVVGGQSLSARAKPATRGQDAQRVREESTRSYLDRTFARTAG
jgi:hypothetical protein